jgi:hypothetical protein
MPQRTPPPRPRLEPPAEDPTRLQGPEIGTLCVLRSNYDMFAERVVRVVARSYVWAPGDPNYGGGVRRYDWKVVEFAPGRHVVVDDKDLAPLPNQRAGA